MTAPVPAPDREVAEAQLRKRVAVALWNEAQATAFLTVDPTKENRRRRFECLAGAAIAAMRGQWTGEHCADCGKPLASYEELESGLCLRCLNGPVPGDVR